MFFFPYGTDAPIYYRPIITILMIAVNVLVFFWETSQPDPEVLQAWMLAVGDGIHPVQWLTTNFMHAGFSHLLGNMLFLWSFGLVVEGKLGPLKTLAVYLGIGIAYGATVQLLTLSHEPTFCLGASAVVAGFMAMCLIWAPENSMECAFLFFYRVFPFELSIKVFAGLYIGLDLLSTVMSNGRLSTEYLHTVGAVWGLAVAVVFLRKGWVDCEHWDVFSVWAGRHKMSEEDRRKLEEERPEVKRQKAEELRKRMVLLDSEIRHAIDVGNAVPALMLIRRRKAEFLDWCLPEPEMLRLIQLLSEQKIHWEAVEMMKEYLSLYHSKATLVQLRLAQTHIESEQPGAALKVLAQVDVGQLDARQLKVYDKLHQMAEKKKADQRAGDGLYELAD